MLRTVEARGAIETAHKLRARVSAIYTFAVAEELAETDPAWPIRAALVPIPRQEHRAAVLTLDDACAVLRAIDGGTARRPVRLAHRLLALTGLRPGEVMGGCWAELHGLETAAPLWMVPAARMKMRREHAVPLSRQAVAVVAELRPLTGDTSWLFPDRRGRPQPTPPRTLQEAIHRTPWNGLHTPHGWRATMSTLLNEAYPADETVIDLMLAHQRRGAVERAYNRSRHMARRRELGQAWADLLIGSEHGG